MTCNTNVTSTPYCVTTTLGEVHMDKLVLDRQNDGLALILEANGTGEHKRFATVFLMKDGWHTKLASQHTRHAWAGPFDSVDDAFEAMKVSLSESL
jgi:hypothetical protein